MGQGWGGGELSLTLCYTKRLEGTVNTAQGQLSPSLSWAEGQPACFQTYPLASSCPCLDPLPPLGSREKPLFGPCPGVLSQHF